MGIETTTSGLDLPLLCRLSYEVGQRKSGTIGVVNHDEAKVRVHMNVTNATRHNIHNIRQAFIYTTVKSFPYSINKRTNQFHHFPP